MTFHPPLHAEIAALLPRLRRFARALTASREGDDLVQIAVERALSRSVQWQTAGRLDSWMLRIVRDAWMDELASRRGREHMFAAPEPAEQAVDDNPAVHQQRLAIQKAVSLLSEDHRVLIGLVLVDGLPYKEAAAVLDISPGALKSRLARAREALQGLLSDQARNLA